MPLNATNTFNQIVSGVKDFNTEMGSLTPSTPIELFEIDMKEVYPQTAFITTNNQPISNGVLRIFNDVNLFNLATNTRGRLYWQNNYYYPFPVSVDGFELNSVGTLPNPKMVLANTSPDGSDNSFYKYARLQIQSLGDLAGCKFTRIRTFLKYLDPSNFSNNFNPYAKDNNFFELELPKDIYYIERKAYESKSTIEYSLCSLLDIENVSLPGRKILAQKCPFQYRGEGCLYEYNKRMTYAHSGAYSSCSNIPANYITLPLEAPPTATDNDELYLGKIFTGDKVNGISDAYIFTGINYVRAAKDTQDSTWSFANFNLYNGSSVSSQEILSDNNFLITGANTNANGLASITFQLNNPAEITKVRLTSTTTIANNFNFYFSRNDGLTWEAVKTPLGVAQDWTLNGKAAGSYITGWPTVGSHKYWKLGTTNTAAGTNLTEVELSGQYRIADSGSWGLGNTYRRGEFTFLEKMGIKYYYVCLTGHLSNPFNAAPNRIFWSTDSCSKEISACRNRWQLNPYFRPVIWPLSRGGWSRSKAYNHLASYSFSVSTLDSAVSDLDSWPRRPMVWDPFGKNAWGLPKDYTGDYLNGFLPFGGFPGVDKRS